MTHRYLAWAFVVRTGLSQTHSVIAPVSSGDFDRGGAPSAPLVRTAAGAESTLAFVGLTTFWHVAGVHTLDWRASGGAWRSNYECRVCECMWLSDYGSPNAAHGSWAWNHLPPLPFPLRVPWYTGGLSVSTFILVAYMGSVCRRLAVGACRCRLCMFFLLFSVHVFPYFPPPLHVPLKGSLEPGRRPTAARVSTSRCPRPRSTYATWTHPFDRSRLTCVPCVKASLAVRAAAPH